MLRGTLVTNPGDTQIAPVLNVPNWELSSPLMPENPANEELKPWEIQYQEFPIFFGKFKALLRVTM
jgi:hypothetical protein